MRCTADHIRPLSERSARNTCANFTAQLGCPRKPKRGSATVKSTSSKSARPRHQQQHSQQHRRGLKILNKGLKKDQPDLKTQRAVISARSPGCSLEFRDGVCEQRSQLAGPAV